MLNFSPKPFFVKVVLDPSRELFIFNDHSAIFSFASTNSVFCDGSNYVWSFKSKNRVFEINWHLSLFDVQKNDVQICSISDLVNLIIALFGLICDVHSLKAKSRIFEFAIDKHIWVCFNVQNMMFEFGRYLIKWCWTHH